MGIDAPAHVVWQWLVQIGQNRGGMYSYDWLENPLGLHIHSAQEIREEWGSLEPGDPVRLLPRSWLGMREGFTLLVALVDPPRSLVLREEPPDAPWNAVWSFHILADGPEHCRLLSRSRSARQRGPSRVAALALDPVTFLMTRKMLLGIKERAERQYRSHTEHAA